MEALKGSEKDKLLEQILCIDFEQLVRVPSNSKLEEMNQETIEPIEHYSLNQFTEVQREKYTQKGWDILRNGEVGVIVVAGGQGSRLGHDGPKGTFDIGLPSHKSLFQLQAERLVNLSSRAAASIPWYIMTSPENHDDKIRFFQTRNYFGYPQEDCMFFQQHTMPTVNQEGKLLFSSDSQIKFVPSGNGHAHKAIPYHVALKKIDSVDAYKLERFIFDFFPLAEKMTVLKVAREEEFAPIKNKEGADSPYTARKLLNLPDLTI